MILLMLLTNQEQLYWSFWTFPFNTIDHDMLLSRLNCKFGVTNMALYWFRSYLSDRYQTVLVHEAQSEKCELLYGVPQGSVLGPTLFNMYTSPLAAVINKHKLQFHSYADDTQIYMPINPRSISDANTAIKNLELCLNNVKLWMQSNMLKVNEEKTELCLLAQSSSYQNGSFLRLNFVRQMLLFLSLLEILVSSLIVYLIWMNL